MLQVLIHTKIYFLARFNDMGFACVFFGASFRPGKDRCAFFPGKLI